MKKKFKDVTIGEMNAECSKHYVCRECPFHDLSCYLYNEDDLEKEVELTEDNNDTEELEQIVHCNVYDNANLIKTILDYDIDGETPDIKELLGVDDLGEFSDGYHTFNQLYHQRAMLFACIVKANKDKAWKTHKHEDGEPCFGGGWFLVTIDTPQGSYGYHYEDKYWDLFDCQELEKAKHWDGYTEEDVGRLLSL